MRLRNAQKSKSAKHIDSEIILVDLFLDGSMRIFMKMGIPTIMNPMEAKESRFVNKYLLVGTEEDPHMLTIDTFDCNPTVEPSESSGKFLFKMTWAANGQQIMEMKVDRIKVFLRPVYFLKISHFFGYGYPEFHDEKPNEYETDFEKFPVMKMKLLVLDSLICVDSFNVDLLQNEEPLA